MKIKLQNVRLSFPGLFKAEPFKPGDDPKFKATFLVEKGSPQAAAVEAAILETAKFKWGAKAEKIINGIRNNPNKFCCQDGDTRSYDGYEGMLAISAKSTIRPLVIDRDRSPLAEEDGKPYAGCYVNASVEFFAYENSGNGISAQLAGVQFVRDGDAFGGGRAADPDEFDDLGEGADTEDELL
jgi:hypothetical protein